MIGNIADDLQVCASDRSHTIVMVELKFDGVDVTGIIREVCAYPIDNGFTHAESWTMIYMYRFLVHQAEY